MWIESGLAGSVCAWCFKQTALRVYADEWPLFLLVLFRAGGKTPDPKLQVRSYVDVMLEQNLSKEEVSAALFLSTCQVMSSTTVLFWVSPDTRVLCM